ncbi:MAG: hypoxanthine phosphoribosyltransferase [Acidobacteria bacterium]|nr:hypoxanthine phosphoribosyltransferase [Acidobacteriota bacterium]
MADHKVLFSRDQILERVREVGRQISRDYAGKELTAIGILNSSFVFLADLIREIDIPVSCYFVRVVKESGLGNKHNLTEIHFLSDTKLEGKHVLLVGTVIDTGITQDYLLRQMELQAPASLKSCFLLDKVEKRKVEFKCDYTAFTIPDQFAIGYGLDHDGLYRNLPFIAEQETA